MPTYFLFIWFPPRPFIIKILKHKKVYKFSVNSHTHHLSYTIQITIFVLWNIYLFAQTLSSLINPSHVQCIQRKLRESLYFNQVSTVSLSRGRSRQSIALSHFMVSVNKVLLDHSHAHSFTNFLQLLSCYSLGVEWLWQRPCGSQSLNDLALFRKVCSLTRTQYPLEFFFY